jgi:hypothetical protein
MTPDKCDDKFPKVKGVLMLTDKALTDLRILQRDFDYIIGVDPGVNTGWAEWSKPDRKLLAVNTWKIHEGIFRLQGELLSRYDRSRILVRLEDARLRKWLGPDKGRDQLQGAGSVKRDSQIWADLCEDLGVACQQLPPGKARTKWSSDHFKKVTGWPGRTSNHARDAAVLVYNF